MPKITNNSARTPKGLPNSTVISPGGSVNISARDWDAMKSNSVVKSWISTKAITVDGVEVSAPPPPPPPPKMTKAQQKAADEKQPPPPPPPPPQ